MSTFLSDSFTHPLVQYLFKCSSPSFPFLLLFPMPFCRPHGFLSRHLDVVYSEFLVSALCPITSQSLLVIPESLALDACCTTRHWLSDCTSAWLAYWISATTGLLPSLHYQSDCEA